MKGQVWQEYVVAAAAVVLLAVVAVGFLFQPSVDAIICSTAYLRAQSEIARQEYLLATDYGIIRFSCSRNSSGMDVNVTCDCNDPSLVGGAVWDTLNRFGVNPNVLVTKLG